MFIREHYVFTEDSFPAVHSRSKIVKQEVVERSPIETAVRSIEKKTADIERMCSALQSGADAPVNALTMALNGVIDAEVNGGLRMYREAFLVPAYLQENPATDSTKWIARLKAAIADSIRVVGEALALHRRLCPPNLVQLQEKLDSTPFPSLPPPACS